MHETFKAVASSRYRGIPGALKIDSAKPNAGPTVGITVCTHGNEIAGLASLVYYLRKDRLKKLLQNGTVIFTINNLEAASRFLESKTEDQGSQFRLLDCNMNRLPEDVLDRTKDRRYEVQRALELYPVFQEFDAALDIHSTSAPTEPVIVKIKGNGLEHMKGAPIRNVITDIVTAQRGIPIASLYGGQESQSTSALNIEAGMQGERTAFLHATRVIKTFLENLGMVQTKKPKNGSEPRRVFRVTAPLNFNDKSYRFTRTFSNFDPIKKGEVLAKGKGEDFVAPQDGHILFPTHSAFDPKKDEAAFLSAPAQDGHKLLTND